MAQSLVSPRAGTLDAGGLVDTMYHYRATVALRSICKAHSKPQRQAVAHADYGSP